MNIENVENPYAKLSLDDLTQLYKAGKLEASYLSKKRLQQLLDYHTDKLVGSKDCNINLIDFCTDELAVIDDIKIDKKKLDSTLGKLMIAFLIVVATMTITSAVSYALGLDWFGALFSRADNSVTFDGSAIQKEKIEEDRKKEDIPDLPTWIPEGYEFVNVEETREDTSSYRKRYDFKNGENSMRIYVMDGESKWNMYAEDDVSYEYKYNNNIHLVTFGEDNGQVVWFYKSKVYIIKGTGLKKAELERMVRSYYGGTK